MAKNPNTTPAELVNPLDGLNKQQVKQLGRAVQRVAELTAKLEKAQKLIADSRFMVKANISAKESAKAVQSARSAQTVVERSESGLKGLAESFKDKPQLQTSLSLYQALEKAAGENNPAARSMLDEVKADLTIATAPVKRERKVDAPAPSKGPISGLERLLNGIGAAVAAKTTPKIGELTERARGEAEDELADGRKRREPNEFQEPARQPVPYPPSVLAKFTLRGNEVINKRTEDVAFVDSGRELRVKGDVSKDVVDALLDTAVSRGWSPVKLFGEKAFKATMWMAFASKGIETQGYTPSKEELSVAAHNRTLNGVDNRIAGEPGKQEPITSTKVSGRGEELPKKGEAGLAGKILEHGEANYNFDKAENLSYFVKLATQAGEKTVWGVDLKRALEQAGAKVGSQVKLENLGKAAVSVVGALRNEKNEVVGHGTIDTHRNSWKASLVKEVAKTLTHNEKLSKAFDEATSTRQQSKAVEKFPELAQAFAAVTVFEKSLNVTSMPKGEAKDFTDQVRGLISERLLAGKPLPEVQVMDQEKERVRNDGQER
ncbi:hypothetical protein JAK51_01470 [Stenotrophomonas maltophilia]|uniref:LPD7 domain-containing protein n=1 Tax=Stenotrophomonas maltophilia TaxID=40324 RepID=UPI0021C8BE93|nr:LPD7 domain-containing protein [Stenotrophomonas maltophilia]MCU1124908.1 hypothetical protein [Stenotrophomonas maltophilia]